MSDVWRELEERLKQKAKTDIQIYGQSTFSNELWVRLEDVKEAINQLKQKYVLVSKEKLIEIYKNLEIDKISGYYVNLEFFRLIEELLKE